MNVGRFWSTSVLVTICASLAPTAQAYGSDANVTAGPLVLEDCGEILLWPGVAPGSTDADMSEKIIERSGDPSRPDRIYVQITHPALIVHHPQKANGVAVIIAPGGGYRRVVVDKEGSDTAAWLNALGITAFVLKYRLPDEGHENGQDVPLQDAQRAVRVVRFHASGWGLDPGKIGFIGYSAGGHLAASVASYHSLKVHDPVDAVDDMSARPDFLILGYAPAGYAEHPRAEDERPSKRDLLLRKYAIGPAIDAGHPPTFLFHADDDSSVDPMSSARIYSALKKAGVGGELHIFKSGGHGFGIRYATGPVSRWPELCAAWLRQIGIIE
jgi:acetyl esterase/lipase